MLRAPLAPLARSARSLALVLRAPARSARSLRSLARPCATRAPRSARSLRSLARPCATRGVRPLPATRSLRSGGVQGARGSPVASRRPRPAASLCPVGACSCAPPRCGSPLGGRCPYGACGVRLRLSPIPVGTLGRAGTGACSPLPRPPPCRGLLAPSPPRFLPLVCASILPAMPPPTPPYPLAHPEGVKPSRKGNPSGRARSPKGVPIGRTPSRIAPTLKGIAVCGRFPVNLQAATTFFIGYRLPIRIGVTRCLLPLSPLASANKFVAALRRYGVARGPGSPRKGATARSCARGPASPLECFSFVCCLSIPLQKRFLVHRGSFGMACYSGSSPPLPLSGSCIGLTDAPLTPFGESGCRGRVCRPCRGTRPPRRRQARPLLFFLGSRFESRPTRKAVSPRCSCPRFARLSVCSNARQLKTFFIGYRFVLHCSLDLNYTCGSLRVGAVCPPRAPPECFSWFCFGFANGPRHPRFCHVSPVGSRRGPLGPDA